MTQELEMDLDVDVSAETVYLEDNVITCDNTYTYSFQSPYEISIDDCLIENIVRVGSKYNISLNISETEAYEAINDFIKEISSKIGLDKDKDKNINKFDIIIDLHQITSLDEDEIRRRPNIFNNIKANIVLDWDKFYVQDNNMELNLILTHIFILQPIKNPLNVLEIIKNTCPKTINPSDAKKLYINDDSQLHISYYIKN